SHMIVRSKAFIVPVCIDDTPDARAEVPESFLKVQWTRLPDGHTTRAFCERIAGLVGTAEPPPLPARPVPTPDVAVPRQRPFPWLVAAIGVGVATAIGWQAWRMMLPK